MPDRFNLGVAVRGKGWSELMRARRFLPLFLTQFFGALNDNLYKNALLVMIVSAGVAGVGDVNTVVNLAAGLFILPFFLFSALAGQMADKYEKSRIIRHIKFGEILIMLLGALAFQLGSLWLMLGVLFLMGTQSAFFGPVKYAILPQHLGENELVAGNARVGMGTFVSILLGTIAGSLIGGSSQAHWLAGAAVVAVALVGWLSSREIPPAEPRAGSLQLDWNTPRISWQLIQLAAQKRTVFLPILGISWFWMLGASYLTQMPNFTVTVLKGEPGVIALVLSAFTVGVAVGSMLCDRLSGPRVEIGLVPLGALGLSLFGIDLYFAAGAYHSDMQVGPLAFLTAVDSWRVLLDILLLGLFGGLYIVPLYAMVQARTDEEKRARIIGANNILNALFMVLASLLGMLFLGAAGFSIAELFLTLALMNIAVALFIFLQVPEFTMRFLVWLMGHSLYRVEHRGLDQIPLRGAAIIVCNHVSYVDALLLAGAVRRPIRFIMYKPIYELPVLNFIFRTGGAIPICSPKEDPEAYQRAMDSIDEALQQGQLLCLFPEGKLTGDGEVDTFKPGIERILARNPVPVIPMALRGLWRSFFSRSNGGAFRKPFRPGWRRVAVVADTPLQAAEASAVGLQARVRELRGDEC
ncbi:MAG: MFS transporter [Gammaproteobacteria bacterium]|nr:MAG: MFS transporter [Gammaproteobacteria bacterium]